MSDINYRLIFNRLAPGAELKKLLVYLQKDLGLSLDRIQSLLTSTHRVLQDFNSQQAAELSQSTLTRMGCFTHLEPVVIYPFLNFAIPQKHERLIKRELSKVLRCRTSLLMLFVQIESGLPTAHLPSMMGSFEDQVADYFRESDTVIGIDDSRIIILGFATDKFGVVPIQGKAHRIIKKLLGDDVIFYTGYSIFPEDGQNLSKLIYLAGIPQKKDETTEGSSKTKMQQPDIANASPQPEDKAGATPLQLCFTRARGRIFKRLLNMDPQTLWLGLSQIPHSQQKEFLCRLPFDSPLTPALEEYISIQPKSLSDHAAENHFNAIIHQMELESGIAEREELLDKVLSKLTHSDDLPTIPSIATKIFKIASNPDSSGTELANIIVRDPALTSKILKTVNSAFYGNPQKISSVKQAIVLLGTEEIVDLAFGLATAKVFDIKPLQGLIDPLFLWHHAICTAMIAQHLCRTIPQYREAGVFTAGLLHDVGKIFLIEKFADIYRQTYAGTAKYNMPLFELEEDHFGINHAIIGKHLSSRWNLPEPLVQAIAHHHQPTNASIHSGLAALTGLANYLYYKAISSEQPSQEGPGHTHWLTVGHWIFLTQIFKDMGLKKLDEMTRDAMAIINENHDYLAIY